METGVVSAPKVHGDDVAAPDNGRPVPDGSAETQAQAQAQEAVGATEAVEADWSKWWAVAVLVGIFLLAFTTSLEGQVTYSVVAFATSSFSHHSLIASVYVIQGVINGKSRVSLYILKQRRKGARGRLVSFFPSMIYPMIYVSVVG